MTQSENYSRIVNSIREKIALGEPRMTLVTESEFGGVYFLHINAAYVEIKPYAQYKEALYITFKKRGGRTLYRMCFYGTKPIAIFAGWQNSSYEQPRSFQCFDKNLFYGLVDGFPQSTKLGEESKRIHLAELQAKGKVYKVVHMPEDRQKMIEELFESAEELKFAFSCTGEFHSSSCRAELQGAPILKNFCGPMYDGDDEQGRAVIRYESQEVYDILSC